MLLWVVLKDKSGQQLPFPHNRKLTTHLISTNSSSRSSGMAVHLSGWLHTHITHLVVPRKALASYYKTFKQELGTTSPRATKYYLNQGGFQNLKRKLLTQRFSFITSLPRTINFASDQREQPLYIPTHNQLLSHLSIQDISN